MKIVKIRAESPQRARERVRETETKTSAKMRLSRFLLGGKWGAKRKIPFETLRAAGKYYVYTTHRVLCGLSEL